MYKLDIEAFDRLTGRQPGSLYERLLEVYLYAKPCDDGRDNSGRPANAYLTAVKTLLEAKILIKIEE